MSVSKVELLMLFFCRPIRRVRKVGPCVVVRSLNFGLPAYTCELLWGAYSACEPDMKAGICVSMH